MGPKSDFSVYVIFLHLFAYLYIPFCYAVENQDDSRSDSFWECSRISGGFFDYIECFCLYSSIQVPFNIYIPTYNYYPPPLTVTYRNKTYLYINVYGTKKTLI